MRLSALLFPLVISGCGYRPGTLKLPERCPASGELRTAGCLDFAVCPFRDPEAEGPAVAIAFANRCDQAVKVDLGALKATGLLRDGRRVAMTAYDPDGELRPAKLDARREGRENIEYQVPTHIAERPVTLCLDFSGVDAGADEPRPVIACVRSTATHASQ